MIVVFVLGQNTNKQQTNQCSLSLRFLPVSVSFFPPVLSCLCYITIVLLLDALFRLSGGGLWKHGSEPWEFAKLSTMQKTDVPGQVQEIPFTKHSTTVVKSFRDHGRLCGPYDREVGPVKSLTWVMGASRRVDGK